MLFYFCRSPNRQKTNTTRSKETFSFTGQPEALTLLPHSPQTPYFNHAGQRQFSMMNTCINKNIKKILGRQFCGNPLSDFVGPPPHSNRIQHPCKLNAQLVGLKSMMMIGPGVKTIKQV